jgi:hypothetical protein
VFESHLMPPGSPVAEARPDRREPCPGRVNIRLWAAGVR